MQIRVLFFGMIKDMVGGASQLIDLPENSSVERVVDYYRERIPKFAEFAAYCAMSVNQEYAVKETRLRSGDEVAFLPPVSGGSTRASDHVQIVRQGIDTQAWIEKLKHPADGAVAVFEGIVRDNSRGRHTLFLDYEAYEPMALHQMERLIEDAKRRFAIRDAAVIHRLGKLEIGETSVLIVVVSAHRAAAFDACRWLIDALKRTVPIWKKEHFEDGAVWADGEPFPADLNLAPGSHPERAASK
ncbi:MAG TPA: molybdenum cofactor biosynthesis protein MoaE [Terriglobales bacterium]